MDAVTLVLEVVTSMFILATKPFSWIRLLSIFGLRSLFDVIQTWIELLRAAIGIHFNIIRSLFIWIISFVTLPNKVVLALQRERLLQTLIYELQFEIEKLVWSRNGLEGRLQKAIKEFRMMEAMLAQVEDEHDKAIVRIELLERELKKAKEENLQLKEVHSKLIWSIQSADDTFKAKDHGNNDINDDSIVSSGSHQQESINNKGRELKPDLDENEVISKQALVQSVSSSILSLLVGMIVWEADDPCMPLVVALFIVVGMSLRSVVRFFSTIENKPASDAVTLLSLNWFVLGTLTYPSLPRVAYMLRPMVLRFWGKVVS